MIMLALKQKKHRRLLIGLFLFLSSCGPELPSSEVEWEESSDKFVLDGSFGQTIRTIRVNVPPKKIKRFRIKADQFTASLTQPEQGWAKLSARHYNVDIQGDPGISPQVTAVATPLTLRTWTLRVHNLGDELLQATIVVTHLPPAPEESLEEYPEYPEHRSAEALFSPKSYHTSHLRKIIRHISGAERSIDIAMYNLSDAPVRRALANASRRGVTLRLLLEDGRADARAPADSRSALFEDLGIDVRYINKIMHHKFAIIDGPHTPEDLPEEATLINGSGNWSYGAASKYDENTVFLSGHGRLITAFAREFNHLWANSRDFVWNDTLEYVTTDTVELDAPLDLYSDGVEAYFTSHNFRTYESSQHGSTFGIISGRNTVADQIVRLISEAETSIWIASGHLRSRPIAEALIAKHQSDPEIDIKVYLDGQEFISISHHWRQSGKLKECLKKAGRSASKRQRCHNKGFYFSYGLHLEGIDVRFKTYAFRWSYQYAPQMHHKYVIVDQNIVATGSYNFSDNAEHNTIENLVLYSSSAFPGLVEDFIHNFETIYETGAGLLSPLRQTIEEDEEFPIVFDSMALDWNDVFDLKSLIVLHCEDIFNPEFKQAPEDHLTCVND